MKTLFRMAIILLLLSIPYAIFISYLNSSEFSRKTLKLASSYLSQRLGYPISAESWSVHPLTLRASIEDLSLQMDKVVLHVSQASVQLSPLGFLLAKLHFSEISFRGVTIAGDVESTVPSGQQESQEVFSINQITESLDTIQRRLKEARVVVAKLKIERAKLSTSLFSGKLNNLGLEFLPRGQAKVFIKAEDLVYKYNNLKFSQLLASFSLLKSYKKNQALLNIYNFDVKLGDSNTLQLTGILPGRVTVKADSNLLKLLKELRGVRGVEGGPKFLSGQAQAQLSFHYNFSELRNFRGNFRGEGVRIDEFFPNNVSFLLHSEQLNLEDLKITDLLVELPDYPLDGVATNFKQQLSSKEISLKGNSLQGVLQAEELNICSIIYASGEPSCQSWGLVEGDLVLAGEVDPFRLLITPRLKVRQGRVRNTTFSEPGGEEVFSYKEAMLLGKIVVNSRKVALEALNLKFNNKSRPLYLEGGILYKPSQVDLKLKLNQIQVEESFSQLLSEQVSARLEGDVRITYSKLIPRSKGRTLVKGNVALKNLIFSNTPLGDLRGKFQYKKGAVDLDSLKLSRRNGTVNLQGRIYKDLNNKRLVYIKTNFNRYPLSLKFSDSFDFSAYLTGNSFLKGPADKEKIRAHLSADLSNVDLNQFSFDSVKAKLNWSDNKLIVNQAAFVKNNRTIQFKGTMFGDQAKLNFSTEDYRLKDIDWIAESLSHVEGGVNFKGYWDNERFNLNGKLNKFSLSQYSFPDSRFSINSDFDLYSLNFSMTDLLKLNMKTGVRGSKKLELLSFSAHLNNKGNLLPFALVNPDLLREEYSFAGRSELNWTQGEGRVKFADIELSRAKKKIIVINDTKTLTWGRAGIDARNMSYQGADLSIESEKLGHRGVKLRGDFPAEIINLLTGQYADILSGRALLTGYLNYPVRLNELNFSLKAVDWKLLEKFNGSSVDRFGGEFAYSDGKLNFYKGQVQVAKGSLDFNGLIDPWQQSMSTLNFKMQRFPISYGSDANVEMSGDVFVKGKQAPFLLGGNVLFDQGSVSLPQGEARKGETIGGDPWLKFALNLNLGPEFLIQDELLSAKLLGKLYLWGDTVDPKIQGFVNFANGGRLNLKNHEFKINRGKIDFSNNKVSNPYMDISSQARVDYTSEYLVHMRVLGYADDPKISFRSNPLLTEKEIIHLLAFSSLPGEEQQFVESTAQAEAFQQLFGNLISKKLMDNTGFQVKIESKREIEGEGTLPKVTVVKKLSDKVTATFGRSLIADKPERDLKVDYRLHRNVGVTGVWENLEQNESSYGVDLRFRFNLK